MRKGVKDNGFEVVQSDFPENMNPSSVNYQNFSCKIGIEYAESLNITHILRIRADMKCNNIQLYKFNSIVYKI